MNSLISREGFSDRPPCWQLKDEVEHERMHNLLIDRCEQLQDTIFSKELIEQELCLTKDALIETTSQLRSTNENLQKLRTAAKTEARFKHQLILTLWNRLSETQQVEIKRTSKKRKYDDFLRG
ncbi:hypothetical protein M0657_011566 [Pyricularia oryzae]|nr:hypothetical protein M9X92_011377 [Pyricularia oryzae]KAI7910013.1 hypothetical protein M0657_011566 [Pyricularia oryzae]